MSTLSRSVDTPAFIALPGGAAIAFFLTAVCGPGHVVPALVLVSVVVFGLGCLSTLSAALGIAGIGWSLLIGFVVVGRGQLRFHWPADGLRLAILVGVAGSGRLARAIAQFVGNRRRQTVSDPYPSRVGPFPTSFQR